MNVLKSFRRQVVAASLVAAMAGAVAVLTSMTGCAAPNVPPEGKSAPRTGELRGFLQEHRGRVLVALLGREDCPGTKKATMVLDDYVSRKPREVDLVRLDVPLPEEKTPPVTRWSHAFTRLVDENRRIADQLDFFYYPTLYVFDREGEKRFEGGCDAARLDAMIKEMLAEPREAGRPKKMYSVVMIRAGQAAPPFSAATLDGKTATLDGLRGTKATLIFFSRTTCPFTVQALPQLRQLAQFFQGKGVNTFIVDQQGKPETIRPVYAQDAAGLPVILDSDGAISKAYGVDAVPSFFLLNDKAIVVASRSFTADAAENALNVLFGQAQAKPRYPASGAG